jgi:hypothetical protein
MSTNTVIAGRDRPAFRGKREAFFNVSVKQGNEPVIPPPEVVTGRRPATPGSGAR